MADRDHISFQHIAAQETWPISLVDQHQKTLAVWHPDGQITLNRTDGTAITLTWDQLVNAVDHAYRASYQIRA